MNFMNISNVLNGQLVGVWFESPQKGNPTATAGRPLYSKGIDG